MMKRVFICLLLTVISVSSTKLLFKPHHIAEKLKTECPDKSRCDVNKTCCEVPTGKYGCCDEPEAVCCADKLHCCPKATICDLQRNKCVRSDGFLTNMHKVEEEADRSEVDLMEPLIGSPSICPDAKSYCLEDQTCCLLAGGMYGCCPFPKAVCCPDMEHCCPSGATCDVASGSCRADDNQVVPWSRKEASISIDGDDDDDDRNVKKVDCPDGRYCLDGQTCCLLGSGDYGCCPYQDAVCCTDRIHCCPHGYKCDPSGGFCNKGSISLLWAVKVEPTNSVVKRVVCPDTTYYCEDGQTCCLLKSGMYGCCPYPKAVCCSDREHCCPQGYTCDPSGLRCNKGSSSSPSSLKLIASNSLALNHKKQCPDKKSYCLDDQTCCLMINGKYGCCPYPQAVCCSDKLHCCPNGYKCDSTGTMCVKGSLTLPSSPKLESLTPSTSLKRVDCPDGRGYCQDGQTCCQLKSGDYGCCPYPNAVCCNDHEHCCPQGYKCDATGQFCVLGSISIPSSDRLKSEIIIKKDVVCPDGKITCPSDNTCCIMKNLQYGCCPLPSATCCSDGTHCCPRDYKCDLPSMTCIKGFTSIPLVEKVNGAKIESPEKIAMKIMKDEKVVCDKWTYCEEGQTCCSGPDGTFKCCPVKGASCCKDGVNCCQYWCIPGFNKCFPSAMKHHQFVKRLEEEPLTSLPAKKVNWCDGESRTLYCPFGFDCDITDGSCIEQSSKFTHQTNDLSMTSLLTASRESSQSSALEILEAVNDVMCDNNSSCPDETTCCKQNQSDLYTCCQFKNAICCPDNIHCCPHGYKCDIEQQSCIRVSDGESSSWGFHGRTRANPPQKREGDARSCPQNHQSCGVGEKSFCCSDDGSICCDDYCCPSGQKCGDEKYTCI